MTQTTNPFGYWQDEIVRRAKEGEPAIDQFRPNAHGGISGYWRVIAARTKPDWPVAVWQRDDGQWLVKWGNGAARAFPDAERHEFEQGTFLNCAAIKKAEFEAASASGQWPDGKPARPQSAEEKAGLDIIPVTPASQGGNAPEDGEAIDEYHAAIEARLSAAIKDAEALGTTIDTQEKAERAAAIRDVINASGKLGEARRKEEKQPHLDAAAAVDNKWAVVKRASDIGKRLMDMIDGFQRRERARLQREADEKAAAERKRVAEETAARLKAEAEQRAAEAAEMGEPEALPNDEDIQAEAQRIAAETVETVEVAKPVVAGSSFSRAATKAKRRRGEIVDIKMLAEHFIFGHDTDFAEYMQKRANSAAVAKIALPGVRVVED